MKVIAYKILRHYAADTLAEMVRAAIAEGWQPQGGVTGEITVSQAMVRHEDSRQPINNTGVK